MVEMKTSSKGIRRYHPLLTRPRKILLFSMYVILSAPFLINGVYSLDAAWKSRHSAYVEREQRSQALHQEQARLQAELQKLPDPIMRMFPAFPNQKDPNDPAVVRQYDTLSSHLDCIEVEFRRLENQNKRYCEPRKFLAMGIFSFLFAFMGWGLGLMICFRKPKYQLVYVPTEDIEES